MRSVRILGALLAAFLGQMVLGRLMPGLAGGLDLPLVVVVWYALAAGPSTGQLVGAGAGLLTDALVAGPLGMFALANTLVGFGVGSVTQRVVVQRSVRILLFAGAAVAQLAIVALTQWLILVDPEPPSLQTAVLRVLSTAALGACLVAAETRLRSRWSRWRRSRLSRLRFR